MSAMRRVEVTAESHKILVIHRRGGLFEGWCSRCSKTVGMVHLAEAATAGISIEAICRRIESGNLHFTSDSGEQSFICLNSLLE